MTLRRLIPILIALALMPATLQARLQAQVTSPELQLQKKVLRILVEGDSPAIPMAIEEMRRRSAEFGFGITFVSKAADPYDARVLLTFGTGKAWDTDPSIRPGEIRFPVSFVFGTATVLMPDGTTVFKAAESGATLQSTSVAVAKEIIKNLHGYYGILVEKHNATAFSEPNSQKPGAASEAITSTSGTIPEEPGIYYKAADDWVRLEQVSPSAVEHRGVGTALLTFGLSGVRAIELYRGAQSRLQIQDRKPTFYVRGFEVSAQHEIVRLAKKKDHREIVAASIKPFDARAGYSEHDEVEVMDSRVSSDVVAITPRTELKPGEYLLTFSALELSYDFGITTDKK